MGKTPKEFTQISPDPAIVESIKEGNQGGAGKASFAHLNKILGALEMGAYTGNDDAKDNGLVEGDFYRLSSSIHGAVCVVF